MSVGIEWDTADFDKKMGKMPALVEKLATEGTGDAGEQLLGLADKQVPIDTGHLKSTGKVSTGDSETAVSYDTPYAVRVHEHPEYRFQRGRKGKYLEDPMKNNKSLFLEKIGSRVQRGLK